ncbi:hypothetical protein [Terriglobus tenax]|uniref:hypothetical protein n=1 Tax=Terriglobus tenax TaxID=1111115 RepID=UPI0021E088DD|nr:hypothetical protein [Terriglobus tenax]
MWQQVHEALYGSAHRVLSRLASLLPGLVALLLAILICTLIGAALAWVVRRILTAFKFDDRINSGAPTSVSDFAPRRSATLLISRVVLWGFVVLGFIIGISTLDVSADSKDQMTVFFLPYVTHSVGAIIIFLIGNLAARFLARTVLIGAVNMRLQYARILSLGIKWLVLVLTAAMILDHLQIGGAIIELAFGILFGGIVLTLSLAVGLGSRDMVSRSLEKNTPQDPFPTPPPQEKPQVRHF